MSSVRIAACRAGPPTVRAFQPPQRLPQILDHVIERAMQRSTPANQYVIMALPQPVRIREPHDLPQPPPHAITLVGAADLP
jgi:hypothetical protein